MIQLNMKTTCIYKQLFKSARGKSNVCTWLNKKSRNRRPEPNWWVQMPQNTAIRLYDKEVILSGLQEVHYRIKINVFRVNTERSLSKNLIIFEKTFLFCLGLPILSQEDKIKFHFKTQKTAGILFFTGKVRYIWTKHKEHIQNTELSS